MLYSSFNLIETNKNSRQNYLLQHICREFPNIATYSSRNFTPSANVFRVLYMVNKLLAEPARTIACCQDVIQYIKVPIKMKSLLRSENAVFFSSVNVHSNRPPRQGRGMLYKSCRQMTPLYNEPVFL